MPPPYLQIYLRTCDLELGPPDLYELGPPDLQS